MSWFAKLMPSAIRTSSDKKKGVPEGLWTKCESCQSVLYRAELERNLNVCPKCEYHHRMNASKRIQSLLDADSPMIKIAEEVVAIDHLKFRDSKKYSERLSAAIKSTGASEAIQVVHGKMQTVPLVLACFDFTFMGGSMGSAVGERFVRGVQYAIEHHLPFVCVSASGGARMQEGLVSLMQMAKTATALGQLAQAQLPYISILTDPTMGGVSASLAMLGDVIIAEPKALIGFAGPRVIEQTVRQTLPEGFQRSEFLLEHGHIDMIVDRRQLQATLVSLLRKFLHLPSHVQQQ